MRLWRKRTTYGCGNCRDMFKTEAQYLGHLNVNGVCPMLAIEREVADWNRRFLQDLKERES